MKRLLMASAAVIALALAAPLAGAQYTQPVPAPPPYEAQQTTPHDPTMDHTEPMTTPAPPATTTQQTDPYAATPQTTPYANTYDTTPQTTANPDPYNTQQQAGVDQSYDSTTGNAQAQTTYADQSYGENTLTDADLTQVALDAGMAGVPMTAAQVCAPRDVALAQNTSRLNRDARRQLIHATDHASVCELQQVTIKAPDGRGDALRQTLVQHGVDDAIISVEDSAGELGVEMAFTGVATSSEYFAQMFNQPQFASATTTSAPSVSQYDPTTGQYTPAPPADPYAATPAEPTEEEADPYSETSMPYEDEVAAEPTSYQPAPDGAPVN